MAISPGTEAPTRGARVVAETVTVLAANSSAADPGLLAPGPSTDAGLVVVALSRVQAVELAAAAVSAELSYILRDPAGTRR